MIYEARAAVRQLYRILKPGGVLLATTHGISKVCRQEGRDPWGEYWRFTSQSARRLFAEVFPVELVTVSAYGNVKAAVAFLHGVSAGELTRAHLDYHDPDYEVLITIRAVRPGA